MVLGFDSRYKCPTILAEQRSVIMTLSIDDDKVRHIVKFLRVKVKPFFWVEWLLFFDLKCFLVLEFHEFLLFVLGFRSS
jgi:hypothetical protein